MVEYEIIKRGQATLAGLEHFYTGKLCKWGHKARRYTRTEGFKVAGGCEKCCELMRDRGMIGETFDEIMSNWDNTSEEDGTSKLPYLSGTSSIGYKVVGYTLVDTSWYGVCSKLLWIKAKDYIKCSLSVDNMRRLGKTRDKLNSKGTSYIFLHRFILGLGVSVKDIVGDHMSGDKLDNRLCNLRIASHKNNTINSKLSKSTSTGFVGVYHDKAKPTSTKQYRAKLCRDSVTKTTHHDSYEAAAKGYDKLLRENYPSEFNRYNFPFDGEIGVKD